ncbi:hypothetical protein G3I29_02460, partial [Streptomyces halstedii]
MPQVQNQSHRVQVSVGDGVGEGVSVGSGGAGAPLGPGLVGSPGGSLSWGSSPGSVEDGASAAPDASEETEAEAVEADGRDSSAVADPVAPALPVSPEG